MKYTFSFTEMLIRKTADHARTSASNAKTAVSDAKQTLKQVKSDGRRTMREVKQNARLERSGHSPINQPKSLNPVRNGTTVNNTTFTPNRWATFPVVYRTAECHAQIT